MLWFLGWKTKACSVLYGAQEFTNEVFTVVPQRGLDVEGRWTAASLGWEERLHVCWFAVGCGEATKKTEWVVAVWRCSVEGRRGWLASCGIVVFSGLWLCGFRNLEAAIPCNKC